MTPEDAPKFLSRLAVLAELFDAKLSEAKQQLYFEALSDLDIYSLNGAMQDAARYCKFMPKPIELRELAEGSEEENAEQAWHHFKADIRRLGQYRGWDTDDENARKAINEVFGGWGEACSIELKPEMWQAKKKEFIRAYTSWERNDVRKRRSLLSATAPRLLGED